MGADFPGDIHAITELRMLSMAAKEYLAHHIRNSLCAIIFGIECGRHDIALRAAEHIEDDLRKIVGEAYGEDSENMHDKR